MYLVCCWLLLPEALINVQRAGRMCCACPEPGCRWQFQKDTQAKSPPDQTKREVCDANNKYHTNPPICWSKELCWWLLSEFCSHHGSKVFSPFSMPRDWSLEKSGKSHRANLPCQKRGPNFQLLFMFRLLWSCYLLVHREQRIQWSYL